MSRKRIPKNVQHRLAKTHEYVNGRPVYQCVFCETWTTNKEFLGIVPTK
jgi:hypothetical protein